MPFKSELQRKFFNANKGTKISPEVVDEFNQESKGMKLPKMAPKIANKPKKMVFKSKLKDFIKRTGGNYGE